MMSLFTKLFVALTTLLSCPVYASLDPFEMDTKAEQTEAFDNKGSEEELAPGELKDPLEPLNRFVFGVNQRIDGTIIRPIAHVYGDVTPKYVRDSVTNFMSNLWFPINFVNFILQGRMESAGKSLFRFITNSTMGVLGILDPAAEFGLEKEDTGFGDTLGSWGMEAGPYLMLPLFGPSTFRGTIGKAADNFGHPLYLWTINKKVNRRNKHHQWWHWYVGKQALELMNTRVSYLKKLDDLEKESLDYYIALRSLHGQDIQAAQEKIRKDREKIMQEH